MVGILLLGLLLAAPSPPAKIAIDYPEEGSIFPPRSRLHVPLARQREGRLLLADRRLVRRWSGDHHATSKGERPAHRQARSGLRRRYQPAAAPTGGAFLDADGDVAGYQEAVSGERRHCRHHWLSCRAGRFRWKGLHSHFPGRGGRAHLLSRRAADALELEKGVIKPLAAEAIPLVAWRVRNVGEARSRW